MLGACVYFGGYDMGTEMGNGISRNGICENGGNVFFTRKVAHETGYFRFVIFFSI